MLSSRQFQRQRAALFTTLDADLLRDALVQLVHVGDDAHQPVPFGELSQHVQRLVQHPVREGTEALVDKQGFHLPAARMVLYHVGEPQRQGQGGEEGLAARERSRAAQQTGAVVKHFDLQPGLGVAAVGVRAVDELIPPAAHKLQAAVCHLQNLPEHRAHYIAVKAQLSALAACAHGERGKTVEPRPGSLARGKGSRQRLRLPEDVGVVFQESFQLRTGGVCVVVLLPQGGKRFVQRRKIRKLLPGGLLAQLSNLLPRVTQRFRVRGEDILLRLQPVLRITVPNGREAKKDFFRAFKSIVGMTPSEWKSSNQL